MLNQNDKIERFADVINKNAQAQCKKIQKRADKFKKEQLTLLEQQTKQELESRLSFELDRISAEINSEISALQNKSKQEIAKRRSEITAEVFEKAGEQLSAFAKSEEYSAFIESSIKALSEQIDGKIIVFAKSDDVETIRSIAAAYAEVSSVETLDNIVIGGIAASSEDESVFVDDTLDARLSAQKEQFMTFSGLSISE
ncbi:MAG: V-type proton ATPase subunit E [Ruminococcus sp.]|nr:V-type proton ATPase subunit E [Ruminococcus sp.]